MRAAQHAAVEHVRQTHVVGVFRRTRNLEWSIDARVAMIENRVLIIWSPPGTGNVIDFDLDRLFDAVDDARDAHLLFWYRRWTRLWLLWHSALHVSLLPVGDGIELSPDSSFRGGQRSFENSGID